MEALSDEFKLEMQRRMLRIRAFDERASKMVKRGHIPGTVHTSIGQEAQVVGATMALGDNDYMTGNHRSHGHPIGKGSPLGPLMAELQGKAAGVCKGKGGSLHLADFNVGSLGESGIVGSSIPIAMGAALSSGAGDSCRDRFVNSEHVLAVFNANAGNAESSGTLGDNTRGNSVCRGRERVLVVFAEEDHGQVPHARHVHRFVENTLVGCSVTEEGQSNSVATENARGKRCTHLDRN